MTTLTYDQLTDVQTQPPDYFSAAYGREAFNSSQSGKYVHGGYQLDTSYLVDTTSPGSKVWEAVFDTTTFTSTIGDSLVSVFNPLCVDDQGSLWGQPTESNGYLVEYSIADQAPVIKYAWTDFNGEADGAGISRLFAFTLPDSSIKLVVLPRGGSFNSNPLAFVATKGSAGLTKYNTITGNAADDWYPSHSFIDDNGDIWLTGTARVPGDAVDTLNLWRITDRTGTSSYDDLISVTLPSVDPTGGDVGVVNNVHARGIFSGGYFVGGWVEPNGANVTDYVANTLFRINLTTGAVTTRDVSSDPVWIPHQQTKSTPSHWFVEKISEAASFIDNVATRAFQEISLTDLSDGVHYDFDQWNVNTPDDIGSIGFLYIDNRPGFIGWRVRETTEDEQTADLFIYVFSGAAETTEGNDSSPLIRVWGFSLDGHDYAVLRLGTLETLVYDLSTKQWAHWATLGRENWRAHVGGNWIGMSADTVDRGFGSDVVAGDDITGTLWVLDPTTGRDDKSTTGSNTITRMTIGGVQLTGRDTLSCGAVTIDLALGEPTQTGATITLEISDDAGQNWVDCGSRVVAASDYSAVVEWRGLGQMKAPGRLFRFTDDGATVRLGGANLR